MQLSPAWDPSERAKLSLGAGVEMKRVLTRKGGAASSAPKDFLRLCPLPQGHLEGTVHEVCSASLWASCFLDVSCAPGHLGLPLMPCPECFTPWPHL